LCEHLLRHGRPLQANPSGFLAHHDLGHAIKREHLLAHFVGFRRVVGHKLHTDRAVLERDSRTKFLARTTAQVSIAFCRVAKAQDEQKTSYVVNGRNKNGGHAILIAYTQSPVKYCKIAVRANEPNVTSHPAPAVPQKTRRASSQPTAAAVGWRAQGPSCR
jgi:hypothetical protein